MDRIPSESLNTHLTLFGEKNIHCYAQQENCDLETPGDTDRAQVKEHETKQPINSNTQPLAFSSSTAAASCVTFLMISQTLDKRLGELTTTMTIDFLPFDIFTFRLCLLRGCLGCLLTCYTL